MDVVGSSLTFCKMINCSCFQLFTISENGAVLFFLVEYCIRLNESNPTKNPAPKKFSHRFICSPRKFRFFKQPMNLVDFCAIIPFLLDLVIGGLQVSKSPVLKNHPFFLHMAQCKIEFYSNVGRLFCTPAPPKFTKKLAVDSFFNFGS